MEQAFPWPVVFSWGLASLTSVISVQVSGTYPRLQKIFPWYCWCILSIFIRHCVRIIMLCLKAFSLCKDHVHSFFILDVIPIASNIVQTIMSMDILSETLSGLILLSHAASHRKTTFPVRLFFLSWTLHILTLLNSIGNKWSPVIWNLLSSVDNLGFTLMLSWKCPHSTTDRREPHERAPCGHLSVTVWVQASDSSVADELYSYFMAILLFS